MVIFPNFSTECMYSNVDRSFKCKDIINLIVINPLPVLDICIYPSPSIKPSRKAIN